MSLRQLSVVRIQCSEQVTKKNVAFFITFILLLSLPGTLSPLKGENLNIPLNQHKFKLPSALHNTSLTQFKKSFKEESRPQAEVKPPSFFERRSEGWHWYQYQESEGRKQESGKKQKAHPLTPTELIEAQRKEIEKKLHAAIVEPTRENLIAYIIAQKALMDQSQRFAEAWKKVLFTTPSLDETLIHPIDQNARHIYYDKQREERTKRIKVLAEDYGLFFFFRERCPYCHGFAPIVKRFAEKYGWAVLGISLDGGALPEFPYTKRDNGMGERLQITHVPALIALHPQTGQLIPLAYGMVSESEIEERIELVTKIKEKLQ